MDDVIWKENNDKIALQFQVQSGECAATEPLPRIESLGGGSVSVALGALNQRGKERLRPVISITLVGFDGGSC
jgi:hypothetical protein